MDSHKRSSSHLDRAMGPTATNVSSAQSGANGGTSAGGGVDNAECWDSISYLESAFHHGFMRSRIKNGEFVYHENPRLMRELDEFCDVDAMHQPKGPIILLGESGVGKSALLANWLVRRKKMFQNWQTSYPEFIFYHVVGCSRQSCLVSNLLERILREIKEYFELTKEIPDVEERLGWQFPRFLEAASKKGRVILIIDGLQRLRTSDGESILKWVPLAFPPNVRIIFSGTIDYPTTTAMVTSITGSGGATSAAGSGGASTAGGGGKGIDHAALGSEHHEKANLNAQMIERIKLEANRRNWISVHVPTLAEDDRRCIVTKFLYKHQPSHVLSSSMSERSNIQDAGKDTYQQHYHHGLQLFEIQEKAIAAVPMTASPYFLKLFLVCLAWATGEGFNVHYVFEQWLSAESIAQLMEAIMRSMETGYTPDPQSTADARQFLVENNYSLPQQLLHAPLRRKVSVDIASASDKQQLVTEMHGTSGASGNFVYENVSGDDVRGRGGSVLQTGTRPGASSPPSPSTHATKEYGYHDVRLATESAVPSEKTISSSVIELKYNESSHRRSSMPIHEKSTVSSSSSGSALIPGATARTDGAHEKKEVFVHTLGTSTGRNQAHATQEDLGLVSSALLSASGLSSGDLQQQQQMLAPLRLRRRTATEGAAGTRSGLGSPPKLLHDMYHQSQSARVPASQMAMFTRASAASEPPTYLEGGRVVQPLGELLGRAFCLLYVCRHGMLTNELRFILSAIVTEERAAATQAIHRRASFSNVKNLEAQSFTAFSESEWKALLRALKPLGVLFVQDVVMLPICKETLREVVWWRYIGSERCEQKYHQWLIRFFRIHPMTFRRVEELPWHLKRCYQWDALRSVLVNLPMFQLLYTANYKHELFGYWRTLTNGPLLLYNSASASAGAGASADAGASVDAPRMYALPFDIVKEYGKSVDEWYRSARPPTKVFTSMVQLVTKFMYEFSLAYQGYLPPFQYAPLDLKRLYSDGFSFVEDLPHVLSSNVSVVASSSSSVGTAAAAASLSSASPSGGISMAPSAATTATTALVAALESFAALGQSSSSAGANGGTTTSGGGGAGALGVSTAREKEAGNWFYFYQRWVWIHFPWLALSKDIVIREPFVNPNGITGGSSSASNGGSAQQQLTDGASGLMAGAAATNGATSLDASRALAADVADGGDEEIRREGGSASRATLLAPLHAGTSSNSAAGNSAKSIIHFDARFWDVKRSMFEAHGSSSESQQQPHAFKKRGHASPPKIATLQNASMLSPAPTIKTQDVISPENLARKKATYVAVKNVLTSSVRRLPTAIATASLPLASVPEVGGPSTDNSNNNSSNSTGQTFLTESLAARGGSELGAGDSLVLDVLSPNAVGSRASPVTRDLVLEHLGASGALTPARIAAFGLPAHFQDYPQSEWDLKRAYNYEVVLKLQTLYDTMKSDVAKKQAHLALVKRKLHETARRYELTLRECEMAKHAIVEMSARMATIERMAVAIERQEKNHRKLLRGCELFPACAPEHFDTMKKALKVLQLQLKDLSEERKVLAVKKTHLLSVELPLLRSATDKSKALMTAVIERLERARAKLMHDQAATDKLYARRLEMLASVRSASVQSGSASREEAERSASQLTASVTTRSLAATAALQQCESMCEKIQKATGFSKLELILQKFVSREELNRSFEEQAKIYDARLKQIKLHEAELEVQLQSLEMSNATTTSDDPRVLEERLRIAELELARIERTQNSLLTTSKEVIAGASRVVKLIGITSCRNPFEHAIPAARLWPPPLGLDGDNNLSSEFETLEPKDIAGLLQVCQDRASLMIDAIEGGRGDPDANYAVQHAIPGKPHASKGLRGDEKLMPRAGGRTRKQPPGGGGGGGSSGDKRDRIFDRGSVPSIVYPGSAGPSPSVVSAGGPGVFALGSMYAPPPGSPDVIDEDESGEDPATRESVKASSRSKIVAKKRAGPGAGTGHNSHATSGAS